MSGVSDRRPTSAVAQWVAVTVVIGSVVGTAMVLVGMEPRLWLVGAIVAVVSAATWLLTDLAAIATPLPWYQHGGSDTASGRPDRRVQLLTARLRSNARPDRSRRRTSAVVGAGGPEPVDEIIKSLVAVLDDHLRAEHGIDRAVDADAASAVLGAGLARFVSDPDTARSMTQRRTLARTIDLIETFTASTAPT